MSVFAGHSTGGLYDEREMSRQSPPAAPAPAPGAQAADVWPRKYEVHLRTREHAANGAALAEILRLQGESLCTPAELCALRAIQFKWDQVLAEMTKFSRAAITTEIMRQATLSGEAVMLGAPTNFEPREVIEHRFSIAQRALRRRQKEISWEAVTLWAPVIRRLESIVRRFADDRFEQESAEAKRFGVPLQPSATLSFSLKTGAYFFRDFLAGFRPEGIAIQPKTLLLGIQNL